MDIAGLLASRFEAARRRGHDRFLVGLCGRAGSGKSTLAGRLAAELSGAGLPCVVYQGDWRFLMDSPTRREWIGERWRSGIGPYLHAINQINWWDFPAIHADLARLRRAEPVEIDPAYDRATGRRESRIRVEPPDRGVILFENAVLGGVEHLRELDLIIVLNTPDATCLERTLRKDADRRPVPEIAFRYLVTTHSENIFLEMLDRFPSRVVACDDQGRLGRPPERHPATHVPIPIPLLLSWWEALPSPEAVGAGRA